MLEFSSDRPIPLEALLELYASVGWTAYTREPETLERSFTGATYVVGAWEADALVGVCRVLSDDASILYVQDILVDPDHQRRDRPSAPRERPRSLQPLSAESADDR